MISLFELFSVGIGPSSSHTVGPMRAAYDFLMQLENMAAVVRVKTTVYGSLAFTGHGHHTDRALLMGLEGYQPESIDPAMVDTRFAAIHHEQRLNLMGKKSIAFNAAKDLVFDYQQQFDYHPNAMRFIAYDSTGDIIHEAVYFSIGGGFILNELDIDRKNAAKTAVDLPYPFASAAELLSLCEQHQLTISELMLANEQAWQPDVLLIKEKLLHIVAVMQASIDKGCHTDGILPGKIGVVRRAPMLYKKLLAEGEPSKSHPQAMNWLNVFAMAVNEENAAGGRIVTAPTNGAAGIIPAVLQYYKHFCAGANEAGVLDYLLTCSAIGMLYKFNASISGAEMGCQGEVGVACSMAAGGLAAALGGNLFQIENAAEMAMEHNLGLTCDPVAGLVQIPCIERNAMAANKAVNAAQLALAESGRHVISLDMVIKTMREIGHDMNSRYKETSQGGLALAVNLSEC